MNTTAANSNARKLLPLTSERLERLKLAYTTSRVPLAAMRAVDHRGLAHAPEPRAGDLVAARVDEIGQHRRLELRTGRRAQLFEGDLVIVCYGNRYAPDQFEAEVPADLGPCDLVAAGGIAARMLDLHTSMKPPTRMTPIGFVCDEAGQRINLEQWALDEPGLPADHRRPPTYAVVGSVMNAGKTTTVANLVRGLTAAGHRVGTCKVTGTGAGGDVWHMTDAGAHAVLDFTWAGLASTYLAPLERVERVFTLLTAHLAAADVDVIVVEVADGVYQRETAALLASPVFQHGVDGLLFAGGDALGAAAGVEGLRRMGLRVLGVSGVLTASPLATREASAAVDVPVLDAEALRDESLLCGCGIEVPRRSGSRTAKVAERWDVLDVPPASIERAAAAA